MSAARPPLPSAAQRLLALLPNIFRRRDHEEAVRIAAAQGFAGPDPLADVAEGPLVTLLAALGQQFDLLEAEVDWLYEDQFIETCADWVVPYIGALVGARILETRDSQSARMQVANTIRHRRAKGTARALAGRAQSVMSAPAEAVEYANHVVHTFNPNFPGDGRAMTTAINGPAGRVLGLPSTIGQHVAELRDMREGGRFAPRNVGVRVWTTRSVAHAEVVPSQVGGGQAGRFRFDPLGRDIVLWSQPASRSSDHPRLAPREMPGPIPLTAAVDAPHAYYGRGKGLLLFVDQVEKPLSEVCFCDLGDDGPGQWNDHGSLEEKNRIRIDPRRGRFVLPGGGAGVDPSSIRVHYRFGAALPIGGAERGDDVPGSEAALRELLGERDRRPEVPIGFDAAATIPDDTTPAQAPDRLRQALDDFTNNPAVLLEFGGSSSPPAATVLPAAGNFELRGGDGVWPTLPLTQPWQLQGGAGSTLTLRGLRLDGNDLVVASDGLRQLTLIDCTVVPGAARIVIGEPGCKLVAVRCVLGRLQVAPAVEIDLVDSLVDSGDADLPAIAAPDGTAGGILWAQRSTIVGDVLLTAFDEVDNSLLAARPGRSLASPPVSAQRMQTGCVRYSAVPLGSIVPRRYRCYPAEGDAEAPAPVFASLVPGEASYGALVAANPQAVLEGAENGGEMGVGNRSSYHARKRLLDRDLLEWVPFGMATATELMS